MGCFRVLVYVVVVVLLLVFGGRRMVAAALVDVIAVEMLLLVLLISTELPLLLPLIVRGSFFCGIKTVEDGQLYSTEYCNEPMSNNSQPLIQDTTTQRFTLSRELYIQDVQSFF